MVSFLWTTRCGTRETCVAACWQSKTVEPKAVEAAKVRENKARETIRESRENREDEQSAFGEGAVSLSETLVWAGKTAANTEEWN